ncbi:MAG: fatty acid CoA ligase family protein [Planctomycetia bacterium]
MTRAARIRGAALQRGAARVDLSAHLHRHALAAPARRAVVEPDGRATSYAELEERVALLAGGLARAGVRPLDRVAVFVRPGAELVAAMFALLRLGAPPVLIDPGMGVARAMRALAQARPRFLLGVPEAVLASHLWRRTLASIERRFVAGRLPAHASIGALRALGERMAPREGHDPAAEAAVLFTSGSTGPAKGVLYTHGNFAAQLEALRALYAFEPGAVDLACFPLFALFDAALGTTSVFPPVDPSRPGRCDPARVVAAARAHGATYAFGSPAVWARVAPWLEARGERLEGLRRILVAGAPIEPALIESLARVAPGATTTTPYGATESLPVASIDGAEILATRAEAEGGAGTCVGRAAPGIEIAIVEPRDGPLERFDEARVLARGMLGEILVRGPQATRGYAASHEADRRAKVGDDGGAWHRMGDLGWIDEQDRLWFCGRAAHALRTREGLVPCLPHQLRARRHPSVRRAALVGVGAAGAEEAVLVLQPRDRGVRRAECAGEVLALCSSSGGHAVAPWPAPARVLWKDEFPLDTRHEAKIRNEDLREWAREALNA